MTRPLRVAVVGARRRRQGTGEFMARDLARAGCEVAAVVGTTPASAREAADHLRAAYGVDPAPVTDLAQVVGEVDAVAIASPSEHHLPALELALEARRHVLCEKPLWWAPDLDLGPAGAARVAEVTGRLAARAAEAGRVVWVNAQWPFTLPAFDALHPGARAGPPRTFVMHMGPTARDPVAMVQDSASHFLSMLEALCGPGRLERVRVDLVGDLRAPEVEPGPDAPGEARPGLDLACAWVHAGGETDARFVLRRWPRPPRPAGYALDGRAAERRIRPAD